MQKTLGAVAATGQYLISAGYYYPQTTVRIHPPGQIPHIRNSIFLALFLCVESSQITEVMAKYCIWWKTLNRCLQAGWNWKSVLCFAVLVKFALTFTSYQLFLTGSGPSSYVEQLGKSSSRVAHSENMNSRVIIKDGGYDSLGCIMKGYPGCCLKALHCAACVQMFFACLGSGKRWAREKAGCQRREQMLNILQPKTPAKDLARQLFLSYLDCLVSIQKIKTMLLIFNSFDFFSDLIFLCHLPSNSSICVPLIYFFSSWKIKWTLCFKKFPTKTL